MDVTNVKVILRVIAGKQPEATATISPEGAEVLLEYIRRLEKVVALSRETLRYQPHQALMNLVIELDAP